MYYPISFVGNLVSISKGKKHLENFNKAGYRYLQIDDLHGNGIEKFTEQQGVEAAPTDILIAWDGANAGKVGVGLNGMIGSTLARLRPTSNEVNSRYLYWLLNSKFELIKSQRTGATIPHVNGNALKDILVLLLPLSQQQQIADTLDKADALRRKDHELLQKYDGLSEAIFYDMFGDPADNNQKFEVSTFLAEVDIKGGKRLPAGHKLVRHNTGLPYIKAGDIKCGRVNYFELEYLLPETQELIKNYTVKKGDVCVTIVGANIGDVGVVPDELDGANLTENAAKLLIKHPDRLNNVYLSNYWRMPFVQEQIRKRSMQVGVPKLAIFRIEELELVVPPLDLQIKFNECVNKLQKSREILLKVIEETNNLLATQLSSYFK